ncbi:hypothetical protein D3C86_1622910 [compost metagenome]
MLNTLAASAAESPLSRSIGTVLITMPIMAVTASSSAKLQTQKRRERAAWRNSMPGNLTASTSAPTATAICLISGAAVDSQHNDNGKVTNSGNSPSTQ